MRILLLMCLSGLAALAPFAGRLSLSDCAPDDSACCAPSVAACCCEAPPAPASKERASLAPCPCDGPAPAVDPLILLEVVHDPLGARSARAVALAHASGDEPPANAPTRRASALDRAPPGPACAMGRGHTRGAPGLLAALSVSRS